MSTTIFLTSAAVLCSSFECKLGSGSASIGNLHAGIVPPTHYPLSSRSSCPGKLMSTPSDDPHPLERRLQALSPTRRAIVERLLREREGRRADMLAPTPIRFEGAVVPRPVRDGLLAVSFGQHRLWFMAQLDSASSVYNTVSSVTLATPVNIKTLQEAVDALVERHESLRTTFEAVGGVRFDIASIRTPR